MQLLEEIEDNERPDNASGGAEGKEQWGGREAEFGEDDAGSGGEDDVHDVDGHAVAADIAEEGGERGGGEGLAESEGEEDSGEGKGEGLETDRLRDGWVEGEAADGQDERCSAEREGMG